MDIIVEGLLLCLFFIWSKLVNFSQRCEQFKLESWAVSVGSANDCLHKEMQSEKWLHFYAKFLHFLKYLRQFNSECYEIWNINVLGDKKKEFLIFKQFICIFISLICISIMILLDVNHVFVCIFFNNFTNSI